ncbi:MAG: LVIVD repeat-containing protein [Chitinophagales bacterium]
MKKTKNLRIIAVLLAVLPVGFSACIKDQCKKIHSYTYYEPVYRTKAEVRANIRSNAPKELKNPGKFYILGNYIFLNEVDKGVHVIDNSNPSQPRNIAFIDIPGNVDLAVKGTILYADLYTDLVAIDISNPASITVKKIVDFVFPERLYGGGFSPDNSKIIIEWKRIDTTITESCDGGQGWRRDNVVFFTANAGSQSASSGPSSGPSVGTGGSMARFAVVNNFMYAVDHHTLKSISLANAADPVMNGNINAGWDIETIYPFKNKLFIGSMNGMFIFDITNPGSPVSQGSFTHSRACDPVIADDNYAYVTLRSGTNCGQTSNVLDIVNIQNLQSPYLKKSYPMSAPKGLSKDNNLLFICDGTAGVKVYNAADVMGLQLLTTITGIEPTDVITYNNLAIVVAKDGIYQYDYSNINNIRLLSKITVNR